MNKRLFLKSIISGLGAGYLVNFPRLQSPPEPEVAIIDGINRRIKKLKNDMIHIVGHDSPLSEYVTIGNEHEWIMDELV